MSSSFQMTLMRVMTLRVWPLTLLKRCASSAIMVHHLMPVNTEASLRTVSYDVWNPTQPCETKQKALPERGLV